MRSPCCRRGSTSWSIRYSTSRSPADDGVIDEWFEAMLPWAQDRINQIGLLPEPRALLLRRWPEGVPPLRQGGADTVAARQCARPARQDRERLSIFPSRKGIRGS